MSHGKLSVTQSIIRLVQKVIVNNMPRIPRRKHTNLDNELEDLITKMETEQIEKQNNIIIGIAVGVMVVACGIIYVAIKVNS